LDFINKNILFYLDENKEGKRYEVFLVHSSKNKCRKTGSVGIALAARH
jgi:hypothetical protein